MLYRSSRELTLGAGVHRYRGFLYRRVLSQAHALTGSLRYRLARTTLIARARPVRYLAPCGRSGWVPRVNLELARQGELFDLGFAVGR